MTSGIDAAEAAALLTGNPIMSNYLNNTLGIVTPHLRARLILQGFRNRNQIADKKDTFARDVCTIIRKQGGTSAFRLTHEMEEMLGKLVKWCRYNKLVQRNMDLDQATPAALNILSEWMDQLPDSEEAELPSKFTSPSQVRSLLENIHTYLGMVKNKAGVPILYVIREDSALPTDDPGFGMPDFHTEVMTRARHNGVYWRSSNRTVWLMMRHICHDTTAWPFISSFESTANGRGAFLAFSQHYMGTDIQHGIRTKAADILQTAKFTGESKNFTFDKFTARLTKAFNDSRDMPDEDKVIKLLNAFQVPSLEWAKGTISATPAYRTNYDAAVAFLAEQVRAKKPTGGSQYRNLSAFGKGKPGKNGKKGGPNKKGDRTKWKFDPKNPTKYCPQHIYIKLDKDTKDKIRVARQSQRGPPVQTQLSEITTKIAALATAVEAVAPKPNNN